MSWCAGICAGVKLGAMLNAEGVSSLDLRIIGADRGKGVANWANGLAMLPDRNSGQEDQKGELG